MTRFRKRPVEVDAFQWFKNGDHPDDYNVPDFVDPVNNEVITGEQRKERGWESRVVRYYRHPDVDGASLHKPCGNIWHDHGWIDTLEGGHNVCPGDWIITGVAGERYPCKPDIFDATYEPVDPADEGAVSVAAGVGLGILAAVVIAAMVAGIIALVYGTAALRGRGGAYLKQQSTTNRIDANSTFYDLSNAYTADLAKIPVYAAAAKHGDQTAATNLTGVVSHCVDVAARYNAATGKYLSKDFLDAGLPSSLNPIECKVTTTP